MENDAPCPRLDDEAVADLVVGTTAMHIFGRDCTCASESSDSHLRGTVMAPERGLLHFAHSNFATLRLDV